MLKKEMTRQGVWLFRWRSYLPLLVLPLAVSVFQDTGWMARTWGEGGEELYDYFCLFIALAGLVLRFAIVGYVPAGTSGRNTNQQNAAFLNTTGFYSVVRHPLYLANFLVFLAFVLLLKSLAFTCFAVVIFFFYYERIMMAEEEFLEGLYGHQFRDWAAKTPAIFPRPSLWQAPALEFSFRSAIGREFHTLLLIGGVFFMIEMIEAVLVEAEPFEHWLKQEPFWAGLALVFGAAYIGIRQIKKRTNWLLVAGR